MTRLELSEGQHGHAVTGLWIGALVGLGVGAVVAVPNSEWGCQYSDTGGLCPVFILGSGVAGALLGTLAGTTVKSERWRDMSLSSLSPAMGSSHKVRFGLALRL